MVDRENKISYSPFPRLEERGLGLQGYITPGLPLAYLDKFLSKIKIKLNQRKADIPVKMIKELTKCFPKQFSWTWHSPGAVEGSQAELTQPELTQVQEERFKECVRGRQLTEADLNKLALEIGVGFPEVRLLAHTLVQQGLGEWIPSVQYTPKGWQCRRCGETVLQEWPGIYGTAATCPSCSALGASTTQQALYRDRRPLNQGHERIEFIPHWELTPAQKAAAQEVLSFAKSDPSKQALLWAACGAGKTEVCFPAAAWALNEGRAVLFAAPRQDVVRDVAPRLLRDFPGLSLQVLTGSSPLKFQSGAMVIATTHQVLRFYRAFDLILLDEMDAFPYNGSRMLEWGLRQALKPDGKILYLTATPSEDILRGAEQNRYPFIRLPARHHRQPLPVPVWEKVAIQSDMTECPEQLAKKIEALGNLGLVLIFVPKISWVDAWVKRFRAKFKDWEIEGSYSSDPERQPKVEGLKQGKFRIFVSTSILERGITIPRVQVIVLAADHPVFDERALVQMAGRAGRTKEFPTGNVLFLAKTKSKAIRTTLQWINEQNSLAYDLGLLD